MLNFSRYGPNESRTLTKVYYTLCSVIQQRVYKQRVHDVDQLEYVETSCCIHQFNVNF